jgi:hypothetical protein
VLSRIPARTAELASVVSTLDPALLVEQAQRHGLCAWLADAFSTAGVVLEAPFQHQLTHRARQHVAAAAKNRRLQRSVLDVLARERVVPIALKGYGLALRLYPQPLVRPATDVDVLVRPSELPQATRALGRLGLTALADAGLENVFTEHHHVAFGGQAGLVEVHFRLFTSFGGGAFDDAALRERATLGAIDGRPVRFLAPEDEFVYLAAHAANHAFLRASWLVDLERFLATQRPLDWTLVADRAHRAGFGRALAVTLAVLSRALAAPLPPEAAAVGRLASSTDFVDRRVFSAGVLASARLAEAQLGNFLVRLWLVDGPRYGLRHLGEGAQRWLRRRRREAGR